MAYFKKREKLEIIVDSCSAGVKVFADIDKLVAHAIHKEEDRPRIFQNYRITIPIQIGTETKRRIFPDMLTGEVHARGRGKFEDFYLYHAQGDEGREPHERRVKVVENSISLAYKLFYAGKAVPLIQDDADTKARIVAEANRLADRYGMREKTGEINAGTLERFCGAITSVYGEHVDNFAPTEKLLRGRHAATGAHSQTIDYRVNVDRRKNLARLSEKFFEHVGPARECLLQAMYSDSQLYRTIGDDPTFKQYRRDQGERSIEQFLFDKRAETNKDRVTIVVTEDQGARRMLDWARSRGNSNSNTVFPLSASGLAKLVDQLENRMPRFLKKNEEQTPEDRMISKAAEMIEFGDYASRAKRNAQKAGTDGSDQGRR